jgi:hypothetical protein
LIEKIGFTIQWNLLSLIFAFIVLHIIIKF